MTLFGLFSNASFVEFFATLMSNLAAHQAEDTGDRRTQTATKM